MPPEEFDEYQGKGSTPYREQYDKVMSKSTPMPSILNKWMMDHRTFFHNHATESGHEVEIARNIRDLTNEMRSAGKVNPSTLYRGAHVEPAVQATRGDALSYTDDPYVARSFASGGGKVYKTPAGSVRGLHLPDYVERQRTVGSGRRPEREWLVDPDSIVGRS